MERRDFVKSIALSSAVFCSPALYAISQQSFIINGFAACTRPNSMLPVIFDVDIVVCGGSAAAVQAAIAATRAGAKVMLISSESYLGDDICGTYSFWDTAENKNTLATKLFPANEIQTPLTIKKILDNELINADIPFLFCTHLSAVLTDNNNDLAGVIIANRSGEQIIKTKMIIDASPMAAVLRLAAIEFTPFKAGKSPFSFTVVGNSPVKTIQHRILSPAVKDKDKEYPAIQYTADFFLASDSYTAYAAIEQQFREMVWDPGQLDSADRINFVAPITIKAQKADNRPMLSVEQLDIACCIPRKNQRIIALNSYIQISRQAASTFCTPINMIALGEKIGQYAAVSTRELPKAEIGTEKKLSENNTITLAYHTDKTRSNYLLGQYSITQEKLPVLGTYDVVVVGGGTAGSCAAIASGEYGMKTLIIEQMHGLGGTGTLGHITVYWDGYRKGFTEKIDAGVNALGAGHPRAKKKAAEWVKDWKMEWFRKENRKVNTEIWFGTISIGAVVDKDTVNGIVVATPTGKGIVFAKRIIDATGSADVAIAAGAEYSYTDGECIAVQGSGLPPVTLGSDYINTDWTFINDSDVFDATATFVAAKARYASYDLGKLLQTRERRRIKGDFEVSVLDIMNKRKFPDVFSYHISSFDTHGFTIAPYFILKPPQDRHTIYDASVPLRALLPTGLDNIIVTGLGISAHRDAMPVLRMQACVQNQGYATGILAAMSIKENTTFRQFNIKKLQSLLVEKNILPQEVITETDTFPPAEADIRKAIEDIPDNFHGLEICLWDTDVSIPIIREKYASSSDAKARIAYAYILAIYGYDDGFNDLIAHINTYSEWDKGWNYTGMGQFGPSMSILDGMLIALGRTKRSEALPVIHTLAAQLTNKHAFSHYRAVAMALESIGSHQSASVLAALLRMPSISGHAVTTMREALFDVPSALNDVSVRNKCLRELFLARALYRCGDYEGLGNAILSRYANDLRGHYFLHAAGILHNT